MVERAAKSRVSNRLDSKKSDSDRVGWSFQKVRYFVGYHALFTPNFMGFFIKSGSGRVGYIPDMEKSGSGSPKKVGFGSGTRKFGYPLHHYGRSQSRHKQNLFISLMEHFHFP